MDDDCYYMITCDEDGDVHVEPLNKADVLARLNPVDFLPVDFLPTVHDTNPLHWGTKALLIKGRIVTPLAKQVVTQFDVP